MSDPITRKINDTPGSYHDRLIVDFSEKLLTDYIEALARNIEVFEHVGGMDEVGSAIYNGTVNFMCIVMREVKNGVKPGAFEELRSALIERIKSI